jgi:glycosyltransferase involved in cell wall biosynthesis
MQHATALINPSLFEGWSTAVEEAKSIGKRIILSDISVHREQNPDGGIFFNPNNSTELANILQEIWINPNEEKDHQLLSSAQKTLALRRNNFANEYEQIVSSVICDL